jgi:group I intron endonuclease
MSYGVIYEVMHRDSGRIYIGQTTTTVPRRWACHTCRARKGEGPSIYLARAIRKYGAKAFDVRTIARANSKAELDYLEQFFIVIRSSDSKQLGFNMTEGGESRQKRHLTVAHKKKIGRALTGIKRSEEFRIGCKNRKASAETKRRISISRWGGSEALERRHSKTCTFCRNDFRSFRASRRFCSRSCAVRWSRGAMRHR